MCTSQHSGHLGFLSAEFLVFLAFVYFSTEVFAIFIWVMRYPFLVKSGQRYFWALSLGPGSHPPRHCPTHLLAAGFDLLAILEPLEGKVWVTDLHHQLDLIAPVHLVGWIQLLDEGCRWRNTGVGGTGRFSLLW